MDPVDPLSMSARIDAWIASNQPQTHREHIRAALDAIRCGEFIGGRLALVALYGEIPIAVQLAFDVAFERADFIGAADAVSEWLANDE